MTTNRTKIIEMNREIKFRGLRTDGKGWAYGNLQVPKAPFNIYYIWDENGRQCEVIAKTIGQFTGLKDKNGVEMYEGDIIDRVYKYEVLFENGKFYAFCKDHHGILTYSEIQLDMAVIGNIHESATELKEE